MSIPEKFDLPLIALREKEAKILPPDAILSRKIHQNAFAAAFCPGLH